MTYSDDHVRIVSQATIMKDYYKLCYNLVLLCISRRYIWFQVYLFI